MPRIKRYFIAAMIISGVISVNCTQVENMGGGDAKIASLSRVQVVQGLETGIISEIYVGQGDVVEQGKKYLAIDPVCPSPGYRKALLKVIGLKAAITRLRSVAYQQPLVFDNIVKRFPMVMDQEIRIYKSEKRALNESILMLERKYLVSMRDLTIAEQLANKGRASPIEMLRLKRSADDIKLQIFERIKKLQADASSELVRLELELSQATEKLSGCAQVRGRTSMHRWGSTVENLSVGTTGASFNPQSTS
ncbi:hypothetical protein [Pseudomonas sp. R5-89-07]|uniref:hypothetical protein n=1 Tax=Pseudomonas sp. R5-89-07 TaxID=658644 RepID=UPI000F57A8E1|nr:hypothetical protein [Pseudomonas sp. R5-89-07]